MNIFPPCLYISSTLLGAAGPSSIRGIGHCLLFDTPELSSGLSVEQIVGFSLIHSSLGFLGCERELSDVKLIPVYYMSIVTGWGCACCLHTVVGEGRAHKELLNPLPGPKSRSAVSEYCRPGPFTLLIYA